MSGDNSLGELFPSSERIAIGGSNPRGTNTVERYQNVQFVTASNPSGYTGKSLET